MGNGTWIKLIRAQRGWLCEATYDAAVSSQFTNVTLGVTTSGRWWWSALFKGWLAARKAKREVETKHATQRVINGWG